MRLFARDGSDSTSTCAADAVPTKISVNARITMFPSIFRKNGAGVTRARTRLEGAPITRRNRAKPR
jgi:hypothetical protein